MEVEKQRPQDVICRYGHSRSSQQLVLRQLSRLKLKNLRIFEALDGVFSQLWGCAFLFFYTLFCCDRYELYKQILNEWREYERILITSENHLRKIWSTSSLQKPFRIFQESSRIPKEFCRIPRIPMIFVSECLGNYSNPQKIWGIPGDSLLKYFSCGISRLQWPNVLFRTSKVVDFDSQWNDLGV